MPSGMVRGAKQRCQTPPFVLPKVGFGRAVGHVPDCPTCRFAPVFGTFRSQNAAGTVSRRGRTTVPEPLWRPIVRRKSGCETYSLVVNKRTKPGVGALRAAIPADGPGQPALTGMADPVGWFGGGAYFWPKRFFLLSGLSVSMPRTGFRVCLVFPAYRRIFPHIGAAARRYRSFPPSGPNKWLQKHGKSRKNAIFAQAEPFRPLHPG